MSHVKISFGNVLVSFFPGELKTVLVDFLPMVVQCAEHCKAAGSNQLASLEESLVILWLLVSHYSVVGGVCVCARACAHVESVCTTFAVEQAVQKVWTAFNSELLAGDRIISSGKDQGVSSLHL